MTDTAPDELDDVDEFDVPDEPSWLAASDEEMAAGYRLRPDELPRVLALFRHPLYCTGLPGRTGPVAWGLQLPDGQVALVLLDRVDGTASTTVLSENARRVERRWGQLMDAELRWVAAPADTALGEQP